MARTIRAFLTRRETTLPLLLLVITVVAVYAPLIGDDFLNFDDDYNVYNNTRVISHSFANLLSFWKAPYLKLYIPVTYSIWLLLAKLSSWVHGNPGSIPDPSFYHLANILFHLGSSLITYSILRKFVKDRWSAFLGAAVFACHPLQVEAVAWVTGLKDVLSGFLALAAVRLYLAARERDTRIGPFLAFYLPATLLYVCGLLSKPSVVVVPVLAALLGHLASGGRWRRIFVELLPWLLAVLPIILITRHFQDTTGLMEDLNIGQRMLVAGDAVTFYLGKIFWPVNMAFDYGRTPQVALTSPFIWLTGTLPYISLPLLVWLGLRRPIILVSLGLFLGGVLPVLGFVPFGFQLFSTVADRFVYLAMLGPALLVASYLEKRLTKKVWLAVCIVMAAMLVKTSFQVTNWSNTNFYAHALEVNPRSKISYINGGLIDLDAKRLQGAVEKFRQVVKMWPDYWEGYNHLGLAYSKQEKFDEALAFHRRALELDPTMYQPYEYSGDVLVKMKRFQEAVAEYELAITIKPERIQLYVKIASAYKELGQLSFARDYLLKGLAIDPNSWEIFKQLGATALKQGNPLAAKNYYLEYLDREKVPAPESYATLAMAEKYLGRIPEAIALLVKTMTIAPGLSGPASALGFLYLEQGKIKESRELFERDLAIDDMLPGPYSGLAIGYYMEKQYAKAVTSYRKAIMRDDRDGMLYNNLSVVYLDMKEYQKAIKAVDQAVALGFSDPQQLQALAPYR
ncbi:MAG: tetratricopeptide repeat protein [Proteobacteria bacterium]|nr:tetratricopeptide repeat protein [Pseudomonadota bacterium]MBU1687328.1 tetratricopeptide repeat protein [Pseudomonadota bacterium]